MRVRVLGTAAGGGVPQWNCACHGCAAARAHPSWRRRHASIAIEASPGRWYVVNATPDIAEQIEAKAIEVLAELKPGRRLYTNVEFYAGIVMDRCGLPREMFTPTFASSRVIGWCAHILEQAADNRLIRPSAQYVGPPPPQPLPPLS